MALDVPAVAYVLPDGGPDPAGVLSLLAKRFPLVAERPDTRAYTVLDTADRRLRAAGLDLELEADREDARLVLREVGGQRPLTADLSDPPRRRYLATDLPGGALRERLAPIVEVRALLPLARLEVETQAVRVLNTDDKTVARLRLTSRSAARPGADDEEPRALPPRVEVAGVLGYPKAHSRVAAALRGESGLTEASAGLADEAIAALGGDPEGIRTRVRVDLRPRQPTDEAALAVLRDLADIAAANLPGTLGDLDTEFLHDLRVAVRRSRSVLRELKGAFPPEPLARQRDALRQIQAVTGPTRDLDVLLLEWDDLVSGLSDERRADLAPLRRLLVRHRATAFRTLQRELRGTAYRQAWDDYRAFLAGDREAGDDRPDAGRPIADVAGRRIRKVYRRMVATGEAIDDTSPAEHLHELRKRGKELRYLLELFGGLWPPDVVKPMVRSLKGLQNVLGTHQDREVQAAYLGGLADEVAGEGGGPATLLALGALVEHLGSAQRGARDTFAGRFAAFASADRRALVATVFLEAERVGREWH